MRVLTKYKKLVTVVAAVVGAALIVWGGLPNQTSWGQGVLVNIGTSLLLLAPLFYLNRVLEEKVDVLDRELRGRVRGLAALKDALPSGPARTDMIDALLSSAKESAAAGRVSEAEFDQLTRGDEFGRTVALAVMLGTSKLFDPDVIIRGVLWSDSAAEQFYALRVAENSWDRLGSEAQRQLVKCLKGDGRAGRRIRNGRSRNAVAQRIRERVRREAAVG